LVIYFIVGFEMIVMSLRGAYVDDRKSAVSAIFMNVNILARIHGL